MRENLTNRQLEHRRRVTPQRVVAAAIALLVNAGLVMWFGPVDGPYLYFKMGPVTLVTLWLVLRAGLSLGSSLRRATLIHPGSPPVYLTEVGWRRGEGAVNMPRTPAVALVLLLAATAALLHGGPLGEGSLSDLGFRFLYAPEARAWSREVLAHPERYVKSHTPPSFVRREEIPTHLRRLGWARVVRPTEHFGVRVSEPALALQNGGGFGYYGYIIGPESLKASSQFPSYSVHRVAPGVYRFVEY